MGRNIGPDRDMDSMIGIRGGERERERERETEKREIERERERDANRTCLRERDGFVYSSVFAHPMHAHASHTDSSTCAHMVTFARLAHAGFALGVSDAADLMSRSAGGTTHA